MNRHDEVTRLIRALHEPEKRELLAWLTESLDDSWRVAETAARHGATDETQEAFTVEEYLALEESSSERHEYAAGLVACGQTRDRKGRFIDEHRVVIEVMSRSTERIDRREKAYIYRELPSIEEIVLISQKSTLVTVYRRSGAWAPVALASPEQALELKSIGLDLPLRQIYEGLP